MQAVARLLVLLSACVLLLGNALAQQPSLEPDTPHEKPVPVVIFDQVFPGSKPSHYSIAVESSGKAAYRSDEVGPDGKVQPESGEPYFTRFVVSDATRTRIFDLAKQANWFKGDFNYTKNRVANTGVKTLIYGEGPSVPFDQATKGARNSTTYIYSENPAIQQLTSMFQSISSTIELGARLDYLRRFDKLGLDSELKHAEEMARQNQLLELQAIAPTLRAIADDYRVMNLARQHARNLLSIAEPATSAGARH